MRVRTSLTQVIAVGALLTLAACSSASAAGPQLTRTSLPDHASPGVIPHATDASNRARAVQLIDRLLADVRMPAGARHRTSAPVRALSTPATTEVSPTFLDRRTWWTVAEPVGRVLSYARHHGVPGCRADGSGSSSGTHTATVREIFCVARSTSYASRPGVQIQAVATAHGSAVRADAQAIWIPVRPAYSQIVNPSSVHVVVERGGKEPTVRRVLGSSGADRLARALNRLPVSTPGTYSCPIAFAGYEDDLTFRTSTGRVRVTVELSGCGGVRISVPGHKGVCLAGSVDGTVRRLLHLPRSYRR